MPSLRFSALSFAAGAIVAGCGDAADTRSAPAPPPTVDGGGSEAPAPPIEWTPCALESGTMGNDAECAVVAVPAMWDRPEVGTIDVAVKRKRATASVARGQLWLLQGGPGESVIGYEPIARTLPQLGLADLDVYLLEHRGVGASSKLDCPDQTSPSSEGGVGVTGGRARILEVGGAFFAKHGVEDVPVEDLLRAAGVSRRTFYKYFRSKDDLLAGIFELFAGRLVELFAQPVAAGAPPLAELRAALDGYLEYHAASGPLLRVLTHEAMRPGSPLAPFRERFQARLMAIADDALKRAKRRPPDPLVYRGLLGAIEAISLDLLSRDAGRADIARAKRVAWEIVTRLLLPGAS